MNLNALTNLTSTAEKPNTAHDRATADSGFETAFQDTNPVEDSTNRREQNTNSPNQKTAEAIDGSTETGHSQSESDTFRESDTAPNGDPATPAVMSTQATSDKAAVGGSRASPLQETHLTSIGRTDPRMASAEQEGVAASSTDPSEAAKQANETRLLTRTSENSLLNSASVLGSPKMNRNLDATEARSAVGAELALEPQTNSVTDKKDITGQAKDATRPVPGTDLVSATNASQTNAKSGVHGGTSHAENAPFLTSAMHTVANHDAVTVDSTHKATSTPAMSLLERHLGGYSVRLLPQNGQASESKTSSWSEGEAVKTLTNAVASSTTNANAPSAAQALSRLVMPEKTNAAQLQADLRVRLDLGSNASQGDAPHEAFGDTRPNSLQTGVGVTQTMAAKPEIAAHVAQQIAQAMKASNGKSVEIALNPVELGRVRMVLSPSDAGITLSILADRPDTLDLMRRNIDDLSKSFSELGYEDISFSFGQNDQTADGDSQHFRDGEELMTLQTDISDLPTTPTTSPTHLATAPDGIDMRL